MKIENVSSKTLSNHIFCFQLNVSIIIASMTLSKWPTTITKGANTSATDGHIFMHYLFKRRDEIDRMLGVC